MSKATMFLSTHGCSLVQNGKFIEKNYTLLVDGQEYRIDHMTRKGSLVIVPVERAAPEPVVQQTAPTPAPTRIQSLGEVLPPPRTESLDLNWSRLQKKVRQYMYFRADGTPTTPQERTDLAYDLCKFVGVSDGNAWCWAREENPSRPWRKNLAKIAEFFAER